VWWVDRVRGQLFSRLAKSFLGPLLVQRERRLALIASCGILGALALSVLAPAWLLLVGPLVLGVPHLASDVRHLVLRRALPRGFLLVVLVACASLIALRGLESLRVFSGWGGRAELGIASLWLFIAWWAGGEARPRNSSDASSSQGSHHHDRGERSAIALGGLVIFLAVISQVWPYESRLFLAHAHNLIALLLWVQLFAAGASQGRGRRWVILPTLLCALSVLTLLWLPAQSLTLRYGVLRLWSFDVLETARWLAPFESARWSLGLTLCYAALQSMHYTLWLYCIPQSDTRAQGSLTFRMTLRSWLSDFGAFALGLLCLATLALILGATLNADGARSVYLSVAGFHAYLELALWVFLLRRGVLPSRESARQHSNSC
ncbi:MAG: hypothetical protein H6716_07145, partial [Polyangiaceae bacterium]|nr:hypothetical protein [Polyangiaceae bacterium]